MRVDARIWKSFKTWPRGSAENITPRAIALIRNDEGLTQLCYRRDCHEHSRTLDSQSFESLTAPNF